MIFVRRLSFGEAFLLIAAFLSILLVIGINVPATKEVVSGFFNETFGAIVVSSLTWYLVQKTYSKEQLSTVVNSYATLAKKVGGGPNDLTTEDVLMHEKTVSVMKLSSDTMSSARDNYLTALSTFKRHVQKRDGDKARNTTNRVNRTWEDAAEWSLLKSEFTMFLFAILDVEVPVGVSDGLRTFDLGTIENVVATNAPIRRLY